MRVSTADNISFPDQTISPYKEQETSNGLYAKVQVPDLLLHHTHEHRRQNCGRLTDKQN